MKAALRSVGSRDTRSIYLTHNYYGRVTKPSHSKTRQGLAVDGCLEPLLDVRAGHRDVADRRHGKRRELGHFIHDVVLRQLELLKLACPFTQHNVSMGSA